MIVEMALLKHLHLGPKYGTLKYLKLLNVMVDGYLTKTV